ncbi:hypothetical protein M378DRAFT_100028 [Amanita muscaria Koide BX008]|uniref:Post-GPI attachment to proteins factor 3 n=1 Tax=Amanita muscaria (strain Koide BX008) TaxID=946122 RepID=A0A0C2XGC3_AMAMK|nr:hypothetical protein M378DRAFT_100028 [Amanita muscaria Koide BX008]
MRLTSWLLSVACFQAVFASSGDRLPEFNSCVSSCTSIGCPEPFAVSLRLTRWTCLDDCRYVCMHQITDMDLRKGGHMQQFFGKWPFWRILGMQEPASVIFSLFNFWAHVNGARRMQRMLPDLHPMKNYYLTWAFVSMNAWFWSAVFHTRDNPTTEKLDYFSAALAILYALYCAIIRLYHLYAPGQNQHSPAQQLKSKNTARTALSIFCILLYLAHVSYLSLLPRFDYAYNIIFNLVVGLLHNIFWLLYALPSSLSILRRFSSQPKSYRPPFAIKAAYCVVVTMVASSLELFDFPPWGSVFDAHSLWHLATAPLAVYWYGFLLEDSLDPSWREHRL